MRGGLSVRRLPFLMAGLLLAAHAVDTFAGAQREVRLADNVRTVLSAQVAGDEAGTRPEAQFDSVTDKVRWLARMSGLLPRKWKPTYEQRMEFLNAVHYESTRAGLEPELVLGLIQVESNFRRYAISSAGARGYMQVMPFWADKIGNGDASLLFDMRANLRFGCTILRHYIDIENGDLFRALGRYNGSLGKAKYPNKVLKAWRRWSAARLPDS
jgi:soluble lytic murein transglycosylase-like protein